MGKIIGAWHWALLLTRGRRCWACQRRYLAHWPWEWSDCQRAPVALSVIGEQGGRTYEQSS